MKKLFAAISLVILAGAGCAQPIIPTAMAPEPVATALYVTLGSGNFFFSPSVIEALPGQQVNITIGESDGFHTFVINEIGLKQRTAPGATFSFVAPATPGRYPIFCDVGKHQEQGMEGVLIVR